MSIKRFNSEKDNTIVNAFKANLTGRGTQGNMGASDILEVFSIYGQANSSSLEQSRIIIQFPIQQISEKRSTGEIPKSGSVSYKLKLFNAEHSQTLPSNFHISAHPLLADWSEGTGLDMESYLDEQASNWSSSSTNVPWVNPGGTYPIPEDIVSNAIPKEYTSYFDSGVESIDMDITQFVEHWIKSHEGLAIASTGSVEFTGLPAIGAQLKLIMTSGDHRIIQFTGTEEGSSGKIIYVPRSASATEAAENLQFHLPRESDFATDRSSDTVSITQTSTGHFGNTFISSSESFPANITNFQNGTGIRNYGILIKLSGSFEDGSNSRSYYTKKFFSRTSQFYLKRPVIEAQIDDSKKDDKSDLVAYTALSPESENINSIYFYNKIRGNLVDIPTTGSTLVVQLLTSSQPGNAPIYQTNPDGTAAFTRSPKNVNDHTRIVASRVETGVYRAQFIHTQSSGTEIIPVWSAFTSGSGLSFLASGSAMTVPYVDVASHNQSSEFVANITNLKSSYSTEERAMFRVYTRNKSWQPNIYTVASQTAPVNTIRDGYYKITRVADNFDVISYSTSSVPSYSSLSYDMSGSYFELDMSILEPNYLYEISLLRKQGSEYIEQKEKFRFRVDP